MTTDDALAAILSGRDAWHAWRAAHPGEVRFARPHWYDSRDARGMQVKGRNRVDFGGMDLSRIVVHGAFAEGLGARGATIVGSHFEEGDFSRADFSGCTFRDTRFNKTILTGASFDGATFVNCSLNRVNLAGASFGVKEITETVVYGVSAWDLAVGEDSRQSKLVIERTYDLYSDLVAAGKVPLTVDDIELAQFVHFLQNHRRMRDTLNVFNSRGVLILGRFRDGGWARLDGIREWFKARGYMAMVFDFERPDALSLTEAVVTMTGLAKFVVADLSGPSVPHELASSLAQFRKPLLALGQPYAMFRDLLDRTQVVAIPENDLVLPDALEKNLPELEAMAARRIAALAERYAEG